MSQTKPSTAEQHQHHHQAQQQQQLQQTLKQQPQQHQKEKLCFDKNDFLKDNFSVDEFLHKNRTAPSLEELRDNLGLYLKSLRASMIELINHDYKDFVSLSANLVDLDQCIDVIKRPLQQFRNNIQDIQAIIEESALEISEQLAKKNQLYITQRDLTSVKMVLKATQQLEHMLTNELKDDDKLEGIHLERAALVLHQLQFHTQFTDKYLNNPVLVASHAKMQENVEKKIRLFFNLGLKSATSTSTESLERCLSIYVILDACPLAEKVFRDDVVAPFMTGIISEQNLQNSPQGLAGIYSRILSFISLHMTDLLRLTLYTDKLHGFNFLVNSFWAEVEMQLEKRMSSIFSPGNATVFRGKYMCSRDFLSKIEELMANHPKELQAFRKHKQTHSFLTRWNLPVYFQICFQDIGGQFEATLDPAFQETVDPNAEPIAGNFHFVQFRSAQRAMQRCWDDGVYLPELFHKFYKLHMQIICRLSQWLNDYLAESGNQLKLGLIAHHNDVQKFVNIMPQSKQTIFDNIPPERRIPKITNPIDKAYNDMQESMLKHIVHIRKSLAQILLAETGSTELIRQVHDLPRLYRKTNREVPTRCSNYVEQLLRPLKAFTSSENVRQLGQDVVVEVLTKVSSNITKSYYVAVQDVLTSVQKTEESLRRLRNLKTNKSHVAASAGTTTDDDKIRLQLHLDVEVWLSELQKMQLSVDNVEQLVDLKKMTDESIKSKDKI